MGKSLKIVLLVPSLDAGGAERQLVILANRLAQRGHNVHVALFRKQGLLVDEVSNGVKIHDLKKGGRADILGFMGRLRRFIRDENPDVLYSFLGVPNLAAFLLKLMGISTPIVWSVLASDVDFDQYTWLTRICWGAETRLSRFANRIISNSHAGLEHAVQHGFSSERMSVVRNGFDTARLVPDKLSGALLRQQWQADQDDILVGIVARLDPMKDHRNFLQAAKLALQNEPGLHFVCIGDGPIGDELREYGDQLGLTNNLVWAGLQADMAAAYNALDMVCLASAGEGLPNVLGEAMSCGIPCVTTDVGDSALVVGDTGIVVPRKNPVALSEGMVAMAKKLRSGDIPDTRMRIEELFSLDRMVDETEAILLEIAR